MSDSEHGSVQNAARNSSQQPEEEQQEQENYLMTFNQFVRIAGSIYLGREFAEDNPFEVVGLGQGRANDETKRAFVDFVACGKLPGPRNRVASLHLDPLEIEERDPDAPEIRVSRDLDSAYGRSQTLCLKMGFDTLKMPNEKDLLKKSLGTKVEIIDNGQVSAICPLCTLCYSSISDRLSVGTEDCQPVLGQQVSQLAVDPRSMIFYFVPTFMLGTFPPIDPRSTALNMCISISTCGYLRLLF